MANGVTDPVIKPYPIGSSSPRTAGIAVNNANIKQQTSLINATHGGKKSRRGGASTITVPTMTVLYPETGAGDQTVNGNITNTTKLGVGTASASAYDACLGQGPSCTAQVAASQSAGKRRKTHVKKKTKKAIRFVNASPICLQQGVDCPDENIASQFAGKRRKTHVKKKTKKAIRFVNASPICLQQGVDCTDEMIAAQIAGKKVKSKRRITGGLKWGCYSGGISRKARKSKKTKSSRKYKK